jgi:tripartite-type tricarboxylate transporter receptor subunit TctC
MMTRTNTFLAISLALIALSIAPRATADQVTDFYKGKTVTIVVGTAAGGAYDLYARSMAKHLPRFIPGSPNIIVQNRTGAASINATNYVYNAAPQDGTVIVAPARGAPLLQILGEKGPSFDATKFQWLGSLNSDAGAMYVWHTSKVKTFSDLRTTPVYFGSSGPNDSEFYPALTNNVLGTKIALIKGYESGPMVRLAMENGEVEGQSQTWDSVKSASPQWISEGKIRVLAQITLTSRTDMEKMGAPPILDLVNRENVLPEFSVDEARSYFRLMLTGNELGRPFAVGPDVPKDRVDALRKAFMAMATDSAFVAESEKEGRNVEPISGDQMQAMLTELAAMPKQFLDNARELVKFRGVVKQQSSESSGGKMR